MFPIVTCSTVHNESLPMGIPDSVISRTLGCRWRRFVLPSLHLFGFQSSTRHFQKLGAETAAQGVVRHGDLSVRPDGGTRRFPQFALCL
jgi:hypothetical protein